MTSHLQSYMAEDAPASERAQMSAIVINPVRSRVHPCYVLAHFRKQNITHDQFTEEVRQIRRAHRGSPLGVIEIASFNSVCFY